MCPVGPAPGTIGSVVPRNRREEREMPSLDDPGDDRLEILPVVVVAQTFPARPSSIPEIRDFVNRCLAESPLSEQDSRAVARSVSAALLEAAGPTGTIQVSFRILPDHAEVDVLRSAPGTGPGFTGRPATGMSGSGVPPTPARPTTAARSPAGWARRSSGR